MQFHHVEGYVSWGDPRIRPAAGAGVERPTELPDEVDLLIVGSGPAGMLLAAQMAQFPSVTTRVIESDAGRLQMGRADGIQARSVETFEAFGFAEPLIVEAYQIMAMNFWNPDPDNSEYITRTSRTVDDPKGLSEFPHLIVNQARILDYFEAAAANAPGRSRRITGGNVSTSTLAKVPTRCKSSCETRWTSQPNTRPSGWCEQSMSSAATARTASFATQSGGTCMATTPCRPGP